MATSESSNHPLVMQYNTWRTDPKNASIVSKANCTIANDQVLAFYGHGSGQFGHCFSNWSKHPIKDDGSYFLFSGADEHTHMCPNEIVFPTSEHAMMWYKCMAFEPDNTELLNKIATAKTPKLVKELGRSVKNYDNDKWSKMRLDVMIHILYKKAEQHPEIATMLAASKGLYIMEASRYDNIWGVGMYPKDAISALNTGKLTIDEIEKNPQRNLLGKAWMRARDSLLGYLASIYLVST